MAALKGSADQPDRYQGLAFPIDQRLIAGPAGYRTEVEFSLTTQRLRIRDWTVDDAEAALATYGVVEVTGWLTPETDRIGDRPAMRAVLQAWMEAQANLQPPRGRWAIERLADGAVVGGLAIRLLPPRLVDLEISFQLRPDEWGNGYAAEAAGALIRWAFAQDIGELYAVALPGNTRATRPASGWACNGSVRPISTTTDAQCRYTESARVTSNA